MSRAPTVRTLALLALLTPAPAYAVDLYSQADAGATFFIGRGGPAEPGPSFGGRLGIGFLSWLSLGAEVSASTHVADVPGPAVGQYFQLYHAGLDLRARVRTGK